MPQAGNAIMVSVIGIALSGCASLAPVAQQSTGGSAGAGQSVANQSTAANRGPRGAEQRGQSVTGAPASMAATVAKPTGPAAFLLVEAERHRAARDYAAAAQALERAMRIEPGNPWLSLALAQVRLDEGQPRQAETLAQRALSKAGDDRDLTARCWTTIAHARHQRGDLQGAAEATRFAGQQP